MSIECPDYNDIRDRNLFIENFYRKAQKPSIYTAEQWEEFTTRMLIEEKRADYVD